MLIVMVSGGFWDSSTLLELCCFRKMDQFKTLVLFYVKFSMVIFCKATENYEKNVNILLTVGGGAFCWSKKVF